MMIDPHFYLKQKKSVTATLINLVVFTNNRRLVYPTGMKIRREFWDDTACRAITDKDYLQQTTGKHNNAELLESLQRINVRIGELDNRIRTLFNYYAFHKIPLDFTAIRQELDKEFNPDKFQDTSKPTTLLEFIQKQIASSNHRYHTRRGYTTTLHVLRNYESTRHRKLTFDDIDLDFYDDFVHWCMEEQYSKNSIGGFVKHIKVFMNSAIDRQLTDNRMHLNRQFKTLQEEIDAIYLSEQELEAIYRLDLSHDTRLERVRDLFLVGCYTGLRFGDLVRLHREHIHPSPRGAIIKLRTQKTDELVVIPVHPILPKIMDRYEGELPKAMSDVKMNKYLKEIGRLSGLDSPVKITRTQGGLAHRTTHPKYELITVHTARRSFATNMYLRDVPSISIMKITGHRSEKAFLKYIRITPEQNASKLLDHPFFTIHPFTKSTPEPNGN